MQLKYEENSGAVNVLPQVQMKEFSTLLSSLVQETVSGGDGVEWVTVEGAIGTGDAKRYRVRLSSDEQKVLEGVINASGFSLSRGDSVLLYKIQNNLSDSFIVARKNSSFETGSSNQTQVTPPDNESAAAEPTNEELIVGRNQDLTLDGTSIAVGTTCTATFSTPLWNSSTRWFYGQSFDYGQQIPFVGSATAAIGTTSTVASLCAALSPGSLRDTSAWLTNLSDEEREWMAQYAQQAASSLATVKNRLSQRIQPGDFFLIVRGSGTGFRTINNCALFGKGGV